LVSFISRITLCPGFAPILLFASKIRLSLPGQAPQFLQSLCLPTLILAELLGLVLFSSLSNSLKLLITYYTIRFY
jgi:aminopeptidase-like protein